MKRTKRTNEPFPLSKRCQRSLAGYVLSGSAAGIGALASVTLAEAEVVYTPTHLFVPAGPGAGYGLDLNGDGVADFQLRNFSASDGGVAFVGPAAHGNLVVGLGGYASALEAGANIGPDGPFAHRTHFATSMAGWVDSSGVIRSSGPWKNTHNRYLGLKFLSNGKYHFGWARLSVHLNTMLLTGYAYETVANKPITAGQETGSEDASSMPSPKGRVGPTLAHLALGVTGLAAWRKEQN